MIQNQVSHFESNRIIQNLRIFLSEFSDFDMKVLQLDTSVPGHVSCPKGEGHQSCSRPQEGINCSELDPALLKDICATGAARSFLCPRGRLRVVLPLINEGKLKGLIYVAESGTNKIDLFRREVLIAFISSLTKYISEMESSLLGEVEAVSSTYRQELFGRVIRFIKMHATDPGMTLEQVARENAVSYYYLSHLFKTELKTTFSDFRQQVRMELAARLLEDCRLTIDQIARTCAFEDPSYFTKCFKKAHGLTPRLFRERLHAPKDDPSPAARIPMVSSPSRKGQLAAV